MSTSGYYQQVRKAYGARKIIWLISAFVIAVVSWAAFASVDEVVLGDGKLVPSASVQLVQSLDGGVLRSLHVREGSAVTAGQLLVTLDETRARASYSEALAEQKSLEARRERLLLELAALSSGGVMNMDPLALDAVEALRNEADSYLANLNELSGRIKRADEKIIQQRRNLTEAAKKTQTLANSLTLLDREIELTAGAVKSGALSASELRKLQRERVSLKGQMSGLEIEKGKLESMVTEAVQAKQSLRDEFRARAQSDLAETQAKLARNSEQLNGLNSQLEQTKLYAGMSGVIKSIETESIGGVIRPGQTIMEIVPEGDQLLVETRISPKDIARVRQGDQAIIKLSAYDFVVYGGIKGQVEHISPDALTNDKNESYFIAHVSGLDDSWREGNWNGKPLIPGMQAEVDILSGKKTILEYWLKPLLRARAQAMREP
ncbi:HlyD family type I secretion periplasmic adaptor subunit [Marinobacter sp. V034]|uniref:HlyD family type I secretion periplasmic adaptor subunit n=1 Tax=Marinobacter sp. V034 TaxID=3459610 RepID=UPI00404508E0